MNAGCTSKRYSSNSSFEEKSLRKLVVVQFGHEQVGISPENSLVYVVSRRFDYKRLVNNNLCFEIFSYIELEIMLYYAFLELNAMLDYVRQRKGLVSPAVLDSELRSKDWHAIQPVAIGDDYSLVVRMRIKEPDSEALQRLCEERDLRLGAIKNFEPVVVKNGDYFGIGKGAVRVTPNFPSSLIERILRLIVKE